MAESKQIKLFRLNKQKNVDKTNIQVLVRRKEWCCAEFRQNPPP